MQANTDKNKNDSEGIKKARGNKDDSIIAPPISTAKIAAVSTAVGVNGNKTAQLTHRIGKSHSSSTKQDQLLNTNSRPMIHSKDKQKQSETESTNINRNFDILPKHKIFIVCQIIASLCNFDQIPILFLDNHLGNMKLNRFTHRIKYVDFGGAIVGYHDIYKALADLQKHPNPNIRYPTSISNLYTFFRVNRKQNSTESFFIDPLMHITELKSLAPFPTIHWSYVTTSGSE
ncbi:unnamed protein product [Didymodactylos carnosus]|uniref:Uncharacterized protein n=1 Tax=Didymodactylos carnosus TaxID=1234261 RepID=A0A815ZT25_9BILA|nr:unnamed protein product [Didymodactylos carnosus]CAF4460650.1 unnamed protein product [Didymodactylos carnosus]